MGSQDGQRPASDKPAAFTAARPMVPRLHLAGLVPHQQQGARSPEQQLHSPASTSRNAGSPRHGGHSQAGGRTPRSALQSSRLGTQAASPDKPMSALWSMALNHISNVLHGGEAALAATNNKLPARGLDADTEDALLSYLHKQILSRQEAKRTFVDGHVTEKIEPIDTRDPELVLEDARAQVEQPAQGYDVGPPSARYWRTVNQMGSPEEHQQRLQQKKDVQQDLRVWADEVLSGRLLHELDMHIDEGPHVTRSAASAASTSADGKTALPSSSHASSSIGRDKAQQASTSSASSGNGASNKELQAPSNTARGLRADLKAQIDAQVEAEIDKRIAMARSQWELNFKADLGLLRSMKDERTQLKAELAAAMNQLRCGGHRHARASNGDGLQPGTKGGSPLSMLGDSSRTVDATGGDSSSVGVRAALSAEGASTSNPEAEAQWQAVQQQLADALQQLADVHEVVGSLVREVESGAVQLQQAQQQAQLERAAKDAALEQVAQLYSQLAAAQQLVEQKLQQQDECFSSGSNIAGGPACDAAVQTGQQEAECVPQAAAAVCDGETQQEEQESLHGRLAAAEFELAQAKSARDATEVGREDAMQALEHATQDNVRLGKQLRAATAAAEAAGAAPWQQQDDVEPSSCSCCAVQVAELRQQLEQAKQQVEALQVARGRSRAGSARADAATSAKASSDGATAGGMREQRSASAMLQQWQEQQQWQQWQQVKDSADCDQPFVFGVFGSNVERMHGAWGLQRKAGIATARAASASSCGVMCPPVSYRVGSAPSSPRRATVCGPQAVKVALQSPQYNTAAGQLVLHMQLMALQQQEQEQLQHPGRRLPLNVATLMQLAANAQGMQAHTSSSVAVVADHGPFSMTGSQTARHSITTYDVDRATGIAAVAGQAHLLPPSCFPSSAAASSPLLSVRACSLQGHASRPASASLTSWTHAADATSPPHSARARRSSVMGSSSTGTAQHSAKVPVLDLQSLQQHHHA